MALKKATKTAGDEKTSLYEVGFLVTPFIGDDATEKELGEISSIIEGEGGKIASEGSLSFTKLAYPIDHKSGNKKTVHESAYFGWVQFHALGENADIIGKKIASKETIVRSLLMHASEVSPRPVRPTSSPAQDVKDEGENVSDAQLDEAIKELVS